MQGASESMSGFADDVMKQKYAHDLPDGSKETWHQIGERVPKHVFGALEQTPAVIALTAKATKFIQERKFIPGGRYLYATGRPLHQVQNCLLMRCEDSREGWAELSYKAEMALMTGAGIGVVYTALREEGAPIKKTGGTASGPIPKMNITNEQGRRVMQGGSRRSAIWAGLHWYHPDIFKFITMKNWSPEIKALKAKDYNFPAPMDLTNVSVIFDDDFFAALNDAQHSKHSLAHNVYWATVRQMLETAEPGISVDIGENAGENLRNACVAGDTEVLTDNGYKRIDSLVGLSVRVWNGIEWSTVTPAVTGTNRRMLRIDFSSGQSLRCTENHKFVLSTDYRGGVKWCTAEELAVGDKLIKSEYPIIEQGVSQDESYAYTQGFISGDGMDGYKFVTVYGPKRMCTARLAGTLGVWDEKQDRGNLWFTGHHLSKMFVPQEWSFSARINWFAGLMDADGTELKEGGAQVCSVNKPFLLATQQMLTTMGVASKVAVAQEAAMRPLPDGHGGLKDYHCQTLYRLMIGAVQMQFLKRNGLRCERMAFDKTPQRDASQFITVEKVEPAGVEETVYCFTEPKRHMGVFGGVLTGQCTEVTSRDDSDICNLGSINMARITSLEEMQEVVEVATAFLLAGTVYSDIPYAKVGEVRTKNRRLGLGLMGLHEWLLLHGKQYGPDAELAKYLDIYTNSTNVSWKYADAWGLSRPIKTRAVAPTGTIGIVGETTTGIEPIFCVAYKRRYLKGTTVNYQYVVDPTAKRLIDSGIPPEQIEDAYSLAENVERRVAFQAWLQQYVDHSISSTVNLPAWGTEFNNEGRVKDFGTMLLKYLPKLRGLTCYPDGARDGQPLTPVKFATAARHQGQIFVEAADICQITKGGGSCGS